MATEVVTAPAGTTETPTTPVTPTVTPPQPASWRSTFEDADVKGSASLDKFKGKDDREILGAVSKAYVNLEKMPRGVNAPKDDAPQAEWDAFYDKLGRPKTADEYAVDVKVPEGMPWSKEAEKNILQHLHKAGLTKRQANDVIQGYLEEAAKGDVLFKQQIAADRNTAERTMKSEWGGMFDMNVALVQRAVGEFGGDEFRQYLDESGLGNDPRFMKFVHSMARPMLEDGMIKGEGLGMKRADAAAEITRLMSSEEYLGKKGRPAQQEALARISELYPIAHAE